MTTKYLSALVVDTKAAGHGGWTAIASTPVVDHDGESLAKGCFLPLPTHIPVHIDHSMKIEHLVGRARPYYDGDKLMLDGAFASTPQAQQVRQLVLEGIVDSMSVVFIDPVRKNINGVQTVTKGVLKACDFVTIGANTEARLVSARSLRTGPAGALAFKAQLAALQAELVLAEVELALGPRKPTDATLTADGIKAALADAKAFLAELSAPAGSATPSPTGAPPRPGCLYDVWTNRKDHR